jgi:hypothetical protein
VLQDTSAVLWRRFHEFQEGTHFDRWACRVAKISKLQRRRNCWRVPLRQQCFGRRQT